MPPRNPRGRPPHADVLTPAEWRVLEAVRHGLSNPQIAERQGVTVDAVKYHVANLLLKLGLSNRGQLKRWNGVRRGSTLRKGTRDMSELALGRLVQISRTVSDIEAAKAWYGRALGLDLLYAFPGMAFFRLADIRLYLHEAKKPQADSILYFSVEDIHAAHAELERRGVEFMNAPHMLHRHPDGTEEWMAEFRDNEGRPLALMCQARAVAQA